MGLYRYIPKATNNKIITTELRTVWITPDGYKFFSKKDAELHCEEFQLIKNEEGETNAEEI